jgi:hypothetical protein
MKYVEKGFHPSFLPTQATYIYIVIKSDHIHQCPFRFVCGSTYPGLQFTANFPEGHILLDTVHTILKFYPRHVHVRYHRANVT